MAYKKGQVEYGDIWVYGEDVTPQGFMLPHSCNDWEIGGRKEAEDLIADLQELIKKHYPEGKKDAGL